jgi:uncharacterized delta-60 repeat protein
VLTAAELEMIDSNGDFPSGMECPWYVLRGDPGERCNRTMAGTLAFKLTAWRTLANGGILTLRYLDWTATLEGWRDRWRFFAASGWMSDVPSVSQSSFYIEPNIVDSQFDGNGQYAVARLQGPVTMDIPLDLVDIGDEFTVQVEVTARTYNRRQRESYVAAYLRDPARTTGVDFVESGVEIVTAPAPLPVRVAPPPPTPKPAAACAGGPDPAAGVLQFEAASIDAFEQARGTARVAVTRSGGGRGAVSAVFSAADGSARAGVDYTPLATVVRFNDGEQGTRMVELSLLDNATVDGDRTVLLSLSQPMGCSALGTQSASTIVIHDDDARAGPVSFSLGGSVAGLAGTGLVLREANSGLTVSPSANGTFTFPAPLLSGLPYDVRVATQPVAPIQQCSVARGTGTVASADIADVAVTCTTPALNGSLDATFGSGGRVAIGIAFTPAVTGAPVAMALQNDGRVLLLGGLKLLRYQSDGAPDAGFGTSGIVTVPFSGGSFDTAQGLALQADGKIVVVGFTRVNNQDDFALARFNADGSLDAGFGSGGKVATDFAGLTDQARRVLVQPDGKIVVAGLATSGTLATADADFAVARYNADGSLDAGFGSGGKVRINIAGKLDTVQGLARQGDGKLVLAGRAGVDGGSDPDVGLVRLNADGSPDATFGAAGIVRTDFGLGNWEEAFDVAVQADGRLLVTGRVRIGAVFNLALARFNADGTPDTGFGSLGLVTTATSTQADVAKALVIQADGRIVVVGQSASLSANPDMVVVRYLATGALDPSFGTAGKVAVDFFGAIDGAEAVALQADGKIVAGGFARNAGTTGFALIRLAP